MKEEFERAQGGKHTHGGQHGAASHSCFRRPFAPEWSTTSARVEPLCSLPRVARRRRTDRRPGESIAAYAERLVPAGSELAAKPVEVAVGRRKGDRGLIHSATRRSATTPAGSWSPQGPTPERTETGTAAHSGNPTLRHRGKEHLRPTSRRWQYPVLRLSQYYRNGSAEKAYPATDCFRWSGQQFDLMQASGPLTAA